MRRKCACHHNENGELKRMHRCEERGFSTGDYLTAVLLSILKERPMHGYEVYEKLNQLEYYPFKHDQAVVYTVLRKLKEFGLLSYIVEEGHGGLRKVYTVTSEGEKFLQELKELIRNLKESFQSFLNNQL